MEHKIKDNIFTIFLCDKIDSNNADTVGMEIENIYKGHSEALVFDAENLQYISSAGLRMILKFRKKISEMKVINVNPEVYDIFDMTGFTEIISIEKAYKKLSVEGCTKIGQGAKGTVYRYDRDTIVKVYNNPDSLDSIKREHQLARRAFVLGIPTAIPYGTVKVGDKFGSVFELLDTKSYSQMIKEHPENIDAYIKDYALLLKQIHETRVKPDDMPDIKILVNKWIETALPCLKKEDAEKLQRLVDETPDTMNLLHCDYHTNNVMYQDGEPLLIDMDTLSHGHPIFELANVYITYVGFGETDPSMVEHFIDLPYDTAKYIWKKFLPEYLGTSDPFVLKDVEDKAMLLSYARLMRHYIRRGELDSEEGKAHINHYRDRLSELLVNIETLTF